MVSEPEVDLLADRLPSLGRLGLCLVVVLEVVGSFAENLDSVHMLIPVIGHSTPVELVCITLIHVIVFHCLEPISLLLCIYWQQRDFATSPLR